MYIRKERAIPSYYGNPGDMRYAYYGNYFQYQGVEHTVPTTEDTDRTNLLDRNSREWYWALYEPTRRHCDDTLPGKTTTGREIIDGMVNGANRNAFNNVYHKRVRAINVPLLMCYKDGTGFRYLFYHRFAFPYGYELPLWDDVREIPLDIRPAQSRAWHNMQPRFEGKISMLNFIWELKDFKGLARSAMSLIDRMRLGTAFSYHRMEKLKKHLLSSVKDPTLPASEGILELNLNIRPLVKDLANIFQQLNIIASEAQALFAQQGESNQTSHYSETLYRDRTANHMSPYYVNWAMLGQQKLVKFSATLQYKYEYLNRNPVAAWMKYWGLSGSFETFWNALPFSFLADYFVNVGKSIHAMEHDPNVNLTSYVYGESIKTSYQYGIFTFNDPLLKGLVIDNTIISGLDVGDHMISGTEGSIYRRYVTEPYIGPVSMRYKLPSARQSLNMVALTRCLFS
jgi:hypothetical protein